MNRPHLNSPGARFRWAREQKKLSQSSLGAQLGISQGAIEKYENNKTQRLKKLADAAKILEQPYEWLAYGEIGFSEGVEKSPQDALNEEQQEFMEIMQKISDPDDMKFLKDQLLLRKLGKQKSDRKL